MSRPTQSDVARLANVSRATVSIVLRGDAGAHIPISEKTRRRVLEAARAIGYTPNYAAQVLAGGKNRLIGVFAYHPFFPYETDDFYYPFLLGIERQASVEDYNLLLFTRSLGKGVPSIYERGAGILGFVDGAVLLGGATNREELRRIASEGRHFVYIGRRVVEGLEIDWVSSDYKSASHEATRRLIDLGHRRIGFLGGRGTMWEPYIDRLAGCREAAVESGVHLEVISHDRAIEENGLAECVKDLELTALICGDLTIFASALERLKAFKVPEDISLVSLGEGSAGHSFPLGLRPTTVNNQRQAVGEAAVRTLVQKIEGKSEGPQQVLVPCTLEIGNTSGPPRR